MSTAPHEAAATPASRQPQPTTPSEALLSSCSSTLADAQLKPAAESGSLPERAEASEAAKAHTDAPYACNICFETAIDSVVTQCGHLYCWSCLHSWFSTPQSSGPTCPVCKAITGADKVIPIYGAGQQEVDPRQKLKVVPPRPRAEVAGPRTGTVVQGAPPFGRVTFQAGVFPLPGLGFTWSSGGGGFHGPGQIDDRRRQGPPNEAEYLGDVMQKMLTVLFIAVFVAMAFS
ncbi:hypothetical protein OIV83_000392 [Microbotryomycetes sp. JL201]|nr:hypothetical protein OIV83_000392 [Microbotryomycetes sp. JL201]